MKKLLQNNLLFFSIIFLSLLTAWPIFIPGYFSHHDDLQVMRIFEMRRCFADFQIPCRWVPDMGFGNGYPLFNFYGVFPYYVGGLASYVLGYIGAAKFLFFLPLVLGGAGMYLLAKELFGKLPGFVGAVLYIFAPYRALDAYVRGAIGESFALAAIPFVFYYFLAFIKVGKLKYFILATLTMGIFLISHNIMTLIFTPVVILWIIFFSGINGWKRIKKALLSFVLALGIASFFIIPAYLEKNLVQTEALTRAELDFRAQFVKVSQLFIDKSWNYGGSQPQSQKTISYQIGWPHWWLVVLAFITLVVSKKRKNMPIFVFLSLLFFLATLMTHNKSTLIWENVKILAFVQFPWRFLSIVVFSTSLIGAYFVTLFKGRLHLYVSSAIAITAVGLNLNYFRPEHFYFDMTDNIKLSGQNFVDQQKGALLDYLPKTALEPRELPPKTPYLVSGTAIISDFVNKSSFWKFKAKIDNEASIEVPVFDFPGWEVYVNGVKTSHSNKNLLGRIGVGLSKGEFVVEGRFMNTPVRSFANIISILSLALLVWIGIYGKNKNFFE